MVGKCQSALPFHRTVVIEEERAAGRPTSSVGGSGFCDFCQKKLKAGERRPARVKWGRTKLVKSELSPMSAFTILGGSVTFQRTYQRGELLGTYFLCGKCLGQLNPGCLGSAYLCCRWIVKYLLVGLILISPGVVDLYFYNGRLGWGLWSLLLGIITMFVGFYLGTNTPGSLGSLYRGFPADEGYVPEAVADL
ncbi:MAG: hypothetical protein HY319_10335 [Armatimonadetes bacterium]|nr:hypothetical protein [Armatimonadota bacterium]